jgi:hypothetical protein
MTSEKPNRPPDAILNLSGLSAAEQDEAINGFLNELKTGGEAAPTSSDDADDLERQFNAAMLEIYERAGAEVGYWATRYLQLLRNRGGLGAARYLLSSKVTSDGYARLRDAGRLDLTVEALVQQPQWESLFSAEELRTARDRFAQYAAMPTKTELEPSAELIGLVERANAAPPDERIHFRDEIAAFGPSAITAVRRGVDSGGSVGFAVGVIEQIGSGHRDLAVAALMALRREHATWESLIDAAVARVKNSSS